MRWEKHNLVKYWTQVWVEMKKVIEELLTAVKLLCLLPPGGWTFHLAAGMCDDVLQGVSVHPDVTVRWGFTGDFWTRLSINKALLKYRLTKKFKP